MRGGARKGRGPKMTAAEVENTKKVILACLARGERKTATYERELTLRCYASVTRKTAIQTVLALMKAEGTIRAERMSWYLTQEPEKPAPSESQPYRLSLGILCPGVKAR